MPRPRRNVRTAAAVTAIESVLPRKRHRPNLRPRKSPAVGSNSSDDENGDGQNEEFLPPQALSTSSSEEERSRFRRSGNISSGDDDDDDSASDNETGGRPIEKILACRLHQSQFQQRGRLRHSNSSDRESNSGPPRTFGAEKGGELESGASESEADETPGAVSMDYYVKFKQESYLTVSWFPKSTLIRLHPSNERRIASFHRRMTDGDPEGEVPLSPRIAGNIKLFSQPDKIIAVRNEGTEYLVKWKLCGYSESTWEKAETLNQALVDRFVVSNQSFYFPRPQRPPVAVAMMAKSNFSSSVKNSQTPRVSAIQAENFKSEAAVGNAEGASRMWAAFLKRKLAADGTYVPSLGTEKPVPPGAPAPSDAASLKPSVQRGRGLIAHQQEGVKWMLYNTEVKHHGSLLADEMGLGKTCQAITYLEHVLDVFSASCAHGCHALVVVQKTVLENWRREFEMWAPHLDVLAVCGNKIDRSLALEYEKFWQDVRTGRHQKPRPDGKLIRPDVVLTTYESLRSPEFQALQGRKFTWSIVVVDECQKIKGGLNSKLLVTLQALQKQFVLLLTGTPVQNTTEELFPMLTLLHPQRFFFGASPTAPNNPGIKPTDNWSDSRFAEEFSNLQEREDCMAKAQELQELLCDYMLRREKNAVLRSLPPKRVHLVHIPLTLVQKRVYSSLYHKSLKNKMVRMTNIHMQLRKCCIHPYLIDGVEDMILQKKISDKTNVDSEGAAKTDNGETDDERAKRLLVDASGKFVLLLKMLHACYAQRKKVLVFSFFKMALDLVEDAISQYELPWIAERVDGETSSEDRQLAVDRFNQDRDRFLFLCTTRAGGLGINLTSATIVIHLDSDFNPQHDLQAQARCHRIGQLQNVTVYHFIAEHTYEDFMLYNIAGKKLGLEAALLGKLRSNDNNSRMDRNQEERVLKRGVFAAIRDDESTQRDARNFAEASLDDILNSKTMTLEVPASDEGGPAEELAGKDREKINNVLPIDEEILSTAAASTATGSVATACSTGGITPSNGTLPPPAGGQTLFSTARFELSEPSGQQEQQSLVVEGLNEQAPDFWEQVAQRLGPWTFDDEDDASSELLTRADRRKGKPTSYLLDSASDEDVSDGEANDGFQPPDNTATSSDSEEESGGESGEATGKAQAVGRTKALQEELADISATEKRRIRRRKAKERAAALAASSTVVADDGAAASASAQPDAALLQNAITSLKEQLGRYARQQPQPSPPPPSTSPPTEGVVGSRPSAQQREVMRQSLIVVDFLYRCLRALARWYKTATTSLKTEEIRECDKWAPWVELCRGKQPQPTGDTLLRVTWLSTLHEWKKAGEDLRAATATIVNRLSKDLSNEVMPLIETAWIRHTAALPAAVRTDTAQLAVLMREFFARELQLAVMERYSAAIAANLQILCDAQAATLFPSAVDRIRGVHNVVRTRQVWQSSEDFCLKLTFIHLLSLQWNSKVRHADNMPHVMRWPPPRTEVDWNIVTEVLRSLNKYTGAPERRKAAVFERFYNFLDSRWSFGEWLPVERAILIVGIRNHIPLGIICEELPGRTFELSRNIWRRLKDLYQATHPLEQHSNVVNDDGRMVNPVPIEALRQFRAVCIRLRTNPSSDLTNQQSGQVQSQTTEPATMAIRHPPRWSVQLTAAVVLPTNDDQQSFDQKQRPSLKWNYIGMQFSSVEVDRIVDGDVSNT